MSELNDNKVTESPNSICFLKIVPNFVLDDSFLLKFFRLQKILIVILASFMSSNLFNIITIFLLRSGLSSISQDDQSSIFTLKMTSGEEVKSRNVILAMGAYFNISGVLTPFTSREMDLTLTSQTIAYIRVSAEEAEVGLSTKGGI